MRRRALLGLAEGATLASLKRQAGAAGLECEERSSNWLGYFARLRCTS